MQFGLFSFVINFMGFGACEGNRPKVYCFDQSTVKIHHWKYFFFNFSKVRLNGEFFASHFRLWEGFPLPYKIIFASFSFRSHRIRSLVFEQRTPICNISDLKTLRSKLSEVAKHFLGLGKSKTSSLKIVVGHSADFFWSTHLPTLLGLWENGDRINILYPVNSFSKYPKIGHFRWHPNEACHFQL